MTFLDHEIDPILIIVAVAWATSVILLVMLFHHLRSM